jgi:2-hydroxychromene-2-carboxylate isomerase
MRPAMAGHERYTDDALAAGVFGAPSYGLESGEFFRGQDQFEFLDRAPERMTA